MAINRPSKTVKNCVPLSPASPRGISSNMIFEIVDVVTCKSYPCMPVPDTLHSTIVIIQLIANSGECRSPGLSEHHNLRHDPFFLIGRQSCGPPTAYAKQHRRYWAAQFPYLDVFESQCAVPTDEREVLGQGAPKSIESVYWLRSGTHGLELGRDSARISHLLLQLVPPQFEALGY